jgi:hypothetical protein
MSSPTAWQNLTFTNEKLANPQATFRQRAFDRELRVLLNLAVGGNWGGQQGVDENHVRPWRLR